MRRLLALCLLVPALSGCGGGGGSTAPSIVGTWRVASIQAQGSSAVSCPGTNGVVTCTATDTLAFRSDGSFTNVSGQDGTFTAGNGLLTISVNGNTVPGNISFSDNGNSVIYNQTAVGVGTVLTYTIVRQ
jgi:hypothetical protein